MLDKDRKGFALEIVMGRKRRPGANDGRLDRDQGDESDDDRAAEDRAGQDLADALESGDGSRIYEAVSAIVDLCGGSDRK
jgi:hypothetical protein